MWLKAVVPICLQLDMEFSGMIVWNHFQKCSLVSFGSFHKKTVVSIGSVYPNSFTLL